MVGARRPFLLLVHVTALLVLALGSTALAAPSGAGGGGAPDVRAIVVLHDDVDARATAQEMERRHDGEVDFVYEQALRGFAGTFPQGRLDNIERDARVAYVEVDTEVHLEAQTVPTGIQRVFANGNANLDIDGSDDHRVDVDVAVIDTGIDFEHPDLDVVGGVDCSGGSPFSGSCETGGDDDHYHGTHVAGSVAAIDNGDGVVGVAPGARLWAVKVLNSNGSGYTSWIVAGIDWVAANAGTIEVANMSLGGSGFSQAQYDAIQGAVDKGVAFAVAAGNSDDDANNYSPAAFDNVLTVSALADFDGAAGGSGSPTCRTDQDDTLADFSNWGDAVQIAAPGVCILSTYPIEQGSYGTISGTSMASPHAAGALAILASSNNPGNATDVHNLYDQVIGSGNLDWVDDSGDGIHEPLLDVSDTTLFAPTLVAGSGGGDTTDDPPTVSVTNPADGATVSGTVSVTADATDDNGVSQVEFLVDSVSIGIDSDGSNGWSVSWDSTTVSDGSHEVTATATDTAGQTTTSAPVGVTVDNSGDGGSGDAQSVHVADLDSASISNGSSWTAVVHVLVHDGGTGGAASGVTVEFAYTSARGQTGSVSCTTGVDGWCSVDASFPKRDASVTFTVTGGGVVVADGHDPDGDSDGTSITVAKP